LITVEELLKSADFLVDDSCVFGVRILQAYVSPKNNLAVAPDNTITIQEVFLQKKEFIKGNYTWNVNNFLALKDPVLSPAFEACGHKWFAFATFLVYYLSGAITCFGGEVCLSLTCLVRLTSLIPVVFYVWCLYAMKIHLRHLME
jgi:hypothetical protein